MGIEEQLKGDYSRFFERASEIYSSSGGHHRLLMAINSGELRGELNEKRYEVAKNILLDFFDGKNTQGNNRVFGISGHIEYLVRKCEQAESPNTALQSA